MQVLAQILLAWMVLVAPFPAAAIGYWYGNEWNNNLTTSPSGCAIGDDPGCHLSADVLGADVASQGEAQARGGFMFAIGGFLIGGAVTLYNLNEKKKLERHRLASQSGWPGAGPTGPPRAGGT